MFSKSLVAGVALAMCGLNPVENLASDRFEPGTTVDSFIARQTSTRQDTSRASQQDSSRFDRPYEPSRRPIYQETDRFGDPLSEGPSNSPLLLGTPTQMDVEVEFDTAVRYNVYERIGDLNYRPPSEMTFEEFNAYMERQAIQNYWRTKSIGLDGESAVSGRQLIPPIYISPVFDRIFGGSYVDLQPNGFVTLDFGGQWQRIDNPAIPIRQQRNGGFIFDQNINMNVVGKVGEKLQLLANFDNNNTFDFENDFKVEYTGFEEEIIQKIEIGNVSMPVSNSLITGSQSLFGVKTQLQFGRLFITGIASRQQGQSDAVEIENGVQARPFELRASEYDENRHFFLGHFFRENYEQWLQGVTQPLSNVLIQRVEVYVINRSNNTEGVRDVVAYMDLAEPERVYQEELEINPPPFEANGNGANRLWGILRGDPSLRQIENFEQNINAAIPPGAEFVNSRDYVITANARKLTDREFYFNPQLGYISLSRRLQNDEMLAVAYEYVYNGQAFKVGELSEDINQLEVNDLIHLKLLRPNKINTDVPTWDLMMKNIYNLNAAQVSQDGFQLRIIYRDDRTGLDNPSLHEGANLKDVPLVQALKLDRLNPTNEFQPDGNFDFIPNITIQPETGTIIFPVLEPFGQDLEELFLPSEQNLVDKYVYDTLYNTTQADARLLTTKDKYFLKGSFQAGTSGEIVLPGINIAEGSVKVFAGNTPLTENVDFEVDYSLGRVRILNEGVLASGKQIRVTYEKADLFNFQARWLLGTRADYRINEKFNIGATLLHLNERPLISRVNIGDEPTQNTKWGLDVNYQEESRFLTKMVDALPLIETKAPSTVTFSGEFAQLIPGTSNEVQGTGTSYIDDFESSATPFNLGSSPQSWVLSATPSTARFTPLKSSIEPFQFQQPGELGENDRRALMSWYIVDNVFYRTSGSVKPDNITDEDMDNNYVRQVLPQEIFPNRDLQQIQTNETIFDIAYFPNERGPYNYNPDLDQNGLLNNPEDNYGAITRAITSDVDFDKTNIEYIEFWLMDPFLEGPDGVVRDGVFNTNNSTGGTLVFNLGNVSEDILDDDRHAFENGLPADGSDENVITTPWGRVTTEQFLTNAFANEPSARPFQDVGLDGLSNEQEANFPNFQDFIQQTANLNTEARAALLADPSGDDFRYYLGDDFDQADAKIVERYKYFRGVENNSPVLIDNNLPYTPSNSNVPDNEDVNNDNTLNDLEEYYEYRVPLEKGGLEVGENYVTDAVIGENGATWYQFRIPVRQPDAKVGDISGYKSIRYVRMYLTQFEQPVVLRMAQYRLVGSQWRTYVDNLEEDGASIPREEEDTRFTVSVVSREENGNDGGGNDIPYVTPPGFVIDRDNTSTVNRRLNEQALQYCVEDLQDRDARAVYKNVVLDLINYGKLKMVLHAQELNGNVPDSALTAFIRLGTDFTENYYEVEVPLVITEPGTTDPDLIWPAANEIDIEFDQLYAVKSARNRENVPISAEYTARVGKYNVSVRGRPDLSSVQTLMLGVRNPASIDKRAYSACIWANELRVTDFDTNKGWAANARLNLQLADFANVTASSRYTSIGFGNVNSRISDRTREEIFQYDISANVNLDKFVSERTGIKVPMFVSYEETTITPQFDPLDPDIPLEASLQSFDTQEQRENYRDIVIDKTVRRSLNFSNVRKIKTNPDAVSRLWDIENFSLSYAYSDVNRSNYQIADYESRNYSGSLAWNYSPEATYVEPFKESKLFKSPYLGLIRDFNFVPYPSTLGFRADLNRMFVKTQLRNENLNTNTIVPQFEKLFTFNRIYNLRWNLTRGLAIDYNARANTLIDEPAGAITQEARDSILTNLKDFGRMKQFDQNVALNYRLPLDKLPFTDWLNADTRYSVGYTWLAGAYDQQDSLGNVISNKRERGITGKADLVKLYNKVTFLKDANESQRPQRNRPGMRPQQPNQPQQPEDSTARENKFLKSVLRALMSVRSINANYTMREGTLIPGFMPEPFLLGMDTAWNSPGIPFLLGSQSLEIKNDIIANDWLAPSSSLTNPIQQTQTINLDLRANVEPLPDLRIQVDAKKSKTNNYKETFRRETDFADEYVVINPVRTGMYNISFLTINTAFDKMDENNVSEAFTQFEENREVIRQRLNARNPVGEYNTNSQDVLIPAFLAAYSGKDATEVDLSPFPKMPLPNWRVDYAGLSKLSIFRKKFSSINISHAYTSGYTVGAFTNSAAYNEGLSLDNALEEYPIATETNENGELLPQYVIQGVAITERFSPLLGVSVRTKSRLTARVEYKRERNLALNLTNNQVTELSSKDVALDLGFTKNNLRLPFRSNGRVVELKNDITFRLSFTIRDTQTIQRRLDEGNTITGGNLNFQLRPNIQYNVNQRLSLQFYFDRTINEPRVSNQPPRSTTRFGTQLRFSLAQ
ncbi:cell surface protein SprA [Roseivirga sp. BDSF3-8]|uniref:T9SS outer membrane translocon Sov/SprA n=1 Tax=Roseivirga sp. BDSF3-8 TaxID=3241598 RepID=UPI003532489F